MCDVEALRAQKAALRRAIRSRYPGDEARRQESEALCAHLLASQAYRQSACIAGYMPMRREADVTPILKHALQNGKRLLLPRVTGDGAMTFRQINSLDALIVGSYGLLEPAEAAPIVPVEEAALLLVPLEGLDRAGCRLGKGGGYYDRILPGYTGLAAAVVMSWQWTEQVPAAPWDCRLTYAADANGFGPIGNLLNNISPMKG